MPTLKQLRLSLIVADVRCALARRRYVIASTDLEIAKHRQFVAHLRRHTFMQMDKKYEKGEISPHEFLKYLKASNLNSRR